MKFEMNQDMKDVTQVGCICSIILLCIWYFVNLYYQENLIEQHEARFTVVREIKLTNNVGYDDVGLILQDKQTKKFYIQSEYSISLFVPSVEDMTILAQSIANESTLDDEVQNN